MMRRHLEHGERARVLTRRAVLMAGAGATAFAGLTVRLWQLQVVQQAEYANLSEDNQFNLRPAPPPRGRVVDRFGAVIADDQEDYQVRVEAWQMKDRDGVLAKLARVIGPKDSEERTTGRVERWKALIARARRFDEVTLETDIDWETFARVNLHRPDLPGVIAETGRTRTYGVAALAGGARRNADAFAHVVGYVSKPHDGIIDEKLAAIRDPQERAQLARIMRHPGYRVGRAGIELTQDNTLQGKWGQLRVEVDAYGRTIREIGLDQATVPGEDVRLTVDAEVQAFAQARLEGESGSAVVIDVETGEVICLVSAPGFDPNRFARGIVQPAYRALINDPRKPLYNKPLAGLYPPGSTFKMITALAALRHGVMDPRERVYCSGKTRLGDRTFHCWKREGHGSIDMRLSIKRSCDSYYYEVAKRVGVDRLAEEALRFGLGSAFGLAAPGGKNGLVPTEAWKRARFDEAWAQGETLIAGIGQGFLLASPLQMAVLTARIATGRAISPRVMFNEQPTPRAEDLGLESQMLAAPEHLAIVRDGMMAVAEEAGGTAYYALGMKGIDLPGVKMAGKTGTSQVFRITEEERADGVRKAGELPWRLRDHGLFIGFAPFDKPKYAVCVVVEHGGGGSTAAAAPARDILREIVRRTPGLVADAGAPARG